MSAIAPVAAPGPGALARIVGDLGASPQQPAATGSFAALLSDGIKSMESKVARADGMVKAFALDDSIPVHQVTFALEEARLSVELAMQVRSRLLEGYRELMNMQL
jgi:flagellar hook-basal body complex protein FliE